MKHKLCPVLSAILLTIAFPAGAGAQAYQFPWEAGGKRIITTGYEGDPAGGHSGFAEDIFALDFAIQGGKDASAGTAATTIGTGKVVTSTCDRQGAVLRGWGCRIKVRHPGGDRSQYAHLQEGSPIKKGSVLCPGAAVGKVGATGNASGAHLHINLYAGTLQVQGDPIKPEPLQGRADGSTPGTCAAQSGFLRHQAWWRCSGSLSCEGEPCSQNRPCH